MPSVDLNAEEKEITDEAFDDFELTDDQVEEAVDAEDEEDDAVETGGESLDDDADGKKEEVVDDGEGAEAGTDTGPKGEKKRDPKTGQFAKDGQKTGEEKTGDAAAAAAAAGEKKPAEAAKPQWEKLSVNVEGKALPIPEAMLSKVNGHHMLAIKDAEFPRFQARMSKAVIAEQMWRPLQEAVAALEEQRAIDAEGPKSTTDKEIEADTIIEFLQGKVKLEDGSEVTRMSLVATPQEVAWLADRVKVKQLEHKAKFTTDRQEFITKRQEAAAAKAAETEEPETQLRGMAQTLFEMVKEHPDFKDVSQDQVREIYKALVPIGRSVFWKDPKDGWVANTELMYATAKDVLAKARAATPAKPGTTAGTSDKTKRAERLNKGSNSTSLKNKRTPLNPGKTGTTEKRKESERETSHSKAAAADAKYRQTTRDYLKSPGFDIPDDED